MCTSVYSYLIINYGCKIWTVCDSTYFSYSPFISPRRKYPTTPFTIVIDPTTKNGSPKPPSCKKAFACEYTNNFIYLSNKWPRIKFAQQDQ